MNKFRREQISEAVSILQTCLDEEQEYYDNMPESIQNGEKGSKAQDDISTLEDAISNLEMIE